SRDAIEHVEKAELGWLRDHVYHPALMPNRHQFRRGGGVVVPKIVMHELVMPQAFASSGVESKYAIAEKIRADPIRAVKIVSRGAEREIGDAALFINRDLAPRVRAADVLPCVGRPRIVAEFAGMRNRVKRPHEFAGDEVVSAQISGRRTVALAWGGTHDDQVFKYPAGRVALDIADRFRIAPQPHP